MKRKTATIVGILALAVAGALYKFVLAAPAETSSKVPGEVYVLPKEFVLNLAGGRYAKLTVALVLAEGSEAGGGHGAAPPEGFGPLAQEPLVREIVTDTLTGVPAGALASRRGRRGFEQRIERAIDRQTDVETEAVAFTDLVVQ